VTLAGVFTVVGLALAAGVFACVRFGIGERLNGPFPYGTLLVNVVAAGLAGLATELPDPWSTIVLVGALGSLSTWSTVAVQVGGLARDGEARAAVLYVTATVTTGLLAAWVGLQAAAAL